MNEIPAAGETFRGDDGTVSTILPANYGQDYEASEGELEEYAEFIGIDVAKEPELMWIAKEGLRAPLPDGWRACQTDDSEVYYFNFQTGDSLWDHPMDEHYKEKVITERAKHRSGSKGGGGALGLAAAPSARTGTTKALTDSLFLKPPVNTGMPLSISKAPVAHPGDGASAPRPAPDVSDILSLAATAASALGPGGSRAASAPFNLKEAEAALRKRLGEQSDAQLRTLRIDFGKKEDAERQRLEGLKDRLQKELDSAWSRENSGAAGGAATASSSSGGGTADTATQRRLQIAREVKQMEDRWKTRLHDVSTRITELQQKVDAQQQTLQKSIYQSPEELKKSLAARNAAEIAQLRETTRKQNEVALQHVKSEHAAELAKAAAKMAETVAAAEKTAEGTAAQKGQERKAQNTAMIASLQATVESRRAELASLEKAAASTKASGTPSGGASPRGGLSDHDKAAIAAAKAAADAEVAEARQAHDLALTRLREEYEAKREEAGAALKSAPSSSRASSSSPAPTPGLSQATSSSGMSLDEQAKLDAEDQKLKDETEKSARIYEEETELMVANIEAGRPLTAAPLPAAAAGVSAEAVAALGRTATQNQRARDAENARHFMAVKQLEAKHEQAVRLLKSQHESAMAAAAATTNKEGGGAAGFNSRQHPSFTMQLNARKRSWLHDHPAPSMEMLTLTPIPALPTATVCATMATATMPDAEEREKIIKTRLTQTRDELRQAFAREMHALQRAKESEIAEWQTGYRASRLAEVQKALDSLRNEREAEVEAAKARAKEHTGANAASARDEAAKKATVAANAKLQALQDRLKAAEMQVADEERECKASVAALDSETALLAEALLKLTKEVAAEEKRRDEQQTKLTAAMAETEKLLATKWEAPAPSSSPAAPSMALFLQDADAAEEEDALRSRWVSLLKGLRTAVQQEMENYERALAESTRIAGQVSTANSAGGGGAAAATGGGLGTQRDDGMQSFNAGFLPPTAPVGSGGYATSLSAAAATGSGPLYHSSLQPGGAASSSSGFTTPLMRPPVSSNLDNRSCLTDNNGPNPHVALFASSQQLPPSRIHAGGAVPSDAVPMTSVSGVACYQDAAMNLSHGASSVSSSARGALSMPYYGGTAADGSGRFLPPTLHQPMLDAPQHSERDAAVHRDAGHCATVADEDQAIRLAALQRAVRERRQELQAQRCEMEQLREEWKEDMRLCKQRDDRAQARKLHAVKEVLEERARRLNKDVLEVKAMQHEVQHEVRRYSQWVQWQMGSDAPATDTGSATAAYTYSSGRNEGGSSSYDGYATADVVSLLESVVARTERLERLLLRNARSPSEHPPSPGRDTARRRVGREQEKSES
ncbi:hypothetical protein ABL78_1797 [Leptomonas seymouri]|uniref:WW domain-containing protein n=1 Tax=Leptomonas seymouri TaxID=5684 RepID=A0A0N1I1N3_LEPSE|nr:hypothetical protein ABL78_1797 [Leptomonas seymouri]|eukprot:KPI89061.1 hypothetical protein ABL78_1797 [Leptomonas seymouri]